MEKYYVPVLNNKIIYNINVPGSKSITNRVLLIAALADGKTVINKVLKSDDTKYMHQALITLRLRIIEEETSFTVYGQSGKFTEGKKTLFLGNAGTAVRFLTAAMVLRSDKTILDGIARMRERPLHDLIQALRDLGARVETPTGCPPVTVFGAKNFGDTIHMNGTNSSQYFSALMQIAPLLPQGLTIKVEGELVSKPYIDLTIAIMQNFGVEVVNNNYQEFKIAPQSYKAQNFTVEGDASSASYWFALAAITGSEITVTNLAYSSLQGDIKFVDILAKMGCEVIKNEESITIIGPEVLQALPEVDMNDMPDSAMTLAIVVACTSGTTKISNIANLRIKETNRLVALSTELNKMRVKTEVGDDYLIVHGTSNRLGAEINTYDDHRMAMCFTVLGTVTPDTVILDPMCANKTYPNFFQEWNKMMNNY